MEQKNFYHQLRLLKPYILFNISLNYYKLGLRTEMIGFGIDDDRNRSVSVFFKTETDR